MSKFLTYSKYVLRHKFFVFVECCKYGMPLRGLLHDMSKLRLSEFIPYMHHFGSGIKTGRDKTGYYKPHNTGDPAFDFAWFLHQKRNSHHWQYWILPTDGGGTKVLEMPLAVRKEMVADWRGAGRAQGTPDVLAWYAKNKDKLVLGPITRAWVEQEIGYIPPSST